MIEHPDPMAMCRCGRLVEQAVLRRHAPHDRLRRHPRELTATRELACRHHRRRPARAGDGPDRAPRRARGRPLQQPRPRVAASEISGARRRGDGGHRRTGGGGGHRRARRAVAPRAGGRRRTRLERPDRDRRDERLRSGDLNGRTSSELVADLVAGARVVKAANTLEAAVLGARSARGRRPARDLPVRRRRRREVRGGRIVRRGRASPSSISAACATAARCNRSTDPLAGVNLIRVP